MECYHCGLKLTLNSRCFHFINKKACLCMGCEDAESDFYKISITGECQEIVENEFSAIISILEGMETGESFTVEKVKMRVGLFLSLPEFTGW